jgi:hypothetical protein
LPLRCWTARRTVLHGRGRHAVPVWAGPKTAKTAFATSRILAKELVMAIRPGGLAEAFLRNYPEGRWTTLG